MTGITGRVLEYMALGVVFLSVIVLVVEPVTGFPARVYELLSYASDFCALFFVTEYVLRLALTQKDGWSWRRLTSYVLSFFRAH